MSATIKRGGASTRRKPAARNKPVARIKARSWANEAMAALPFTEGQMRKGLTWLMLALIAAAAWFAAALSGLNTYAYEEFAHASARAGFAVKKIEVRGVKQMDELDVYDKVLARKDLAMPMVDVEQLRNELMGIDPENPDAPRNGWIADARVSRQLPDTLLVDIIERTPHAVWRNGDKLTLIDRDGHALDTVSAERATGMLRITGADANNKVENLTALLEAAPALKPQMREAEWVGRRRWNITFKSGETIALPEGRNKAQAALITFARMDGVNRLLGGKITFFDLRSAERAYVRVQGGGDKADN